MGSEQSSQQAKQAKRAPPIRRGYTIATSSRHVSEPSASGNDSPGTSMCSDSELPYISYTVGRPIGDSPKHTAKRPTNQRRPLIQRRQTISSPRQKQNHGIVVVKTQSCPNLDADLARLQDIPTFLPIMRATLGLPGAKDLDILEGLDCQPWIRLTTRYQAHLAASAQPLANEQALLTGRIKELDIDISKLHAQFVERQRSNAKNAERLSRVREMNHQLSRCTSILNQALQDIEELNNLLPENKRLDPFVWTHG